MGGEPYCTGESCHGGWRDSFMSHAALHDMTRSTSDGPGLSVVPQQLTLLCHAKRLGTTGPTWHHVGSGARTCPMCHANAHGMTYS
jgi:hypothetical protein